jgi:hypothetical protein
MKQGGPRKAKAEAYTPAETLALRGSRRVEVELDLGAVGVVAEQLPDARAGLPAQVVLDAGGVEPGLHRLDVARRERHVVDHAGALRRGLAVEVEVQDRLGAVAVEPGAVEAEVRPPAFLQAEQADVEIERLLPVLGDDGEVVHADDHGRSSAFGSGDDDSQAISTSAPIVRRDSSRRCASSAAPRAWRSIGGA